MMSGGSIASWTTLNKSLFKGDAACVMPAAIPSPPQAPRCSRDAAWGVWAGSGPRLGRAHGPRDRDLLSGGEQAAPTGASTFPQLGEHPAWPPGSR